MKVAIKQPEASAAAGERKLPRLNFETIQRTPTASQITKCGDLQKEPAKVG